MNREAPGSKSWVVYELVDPLDKRVLVRDYDTIEYVRMLMPLPVVEGSGPVLECIRAGRIPELRIVDQGLTEPRAKGLVEQWDRGVLAVISAFQWNNSPIYQ